MKSHNITFVPKVCQGEDAEFSGQIILRPPGIEERLELTCNPETMEMLNEHLKKEHEAEKKHDLKEDEIESLNPNQMKVLIHQLKWSYQFYVKVDITRLKDKFHFKDLDSLRVDSSCGRILQEIALKLSRGFELGNT